MSERQAPPWTQSVLPEEIIRQRAEKWPDFHPETFCHRCGNRNIVWWVDSKLWNMATEGRPRGEFDILCPSCFSALLEAKIGRRVLWQLAVDPSGGAVREGLISKALEGS